VRRRLAAALALLPLLLALPAAAAAHPDEPEGGHSTLNPQGAGADILGDEVRTLLILGGAVYLLVVAILTAIVLRQRRPATADEPVFGHDKAGRRWIWAGGLALPLIVISAVLAVSAHTLTALGAPTREAPLTIEVYGHRWWWEVVYPDGGVRSANEMAIPVGRPVTVRLRTKDVIHSFWVPELTRKVDLTPGKVGSVELTARQPGYFRGECAEFCGLQHARMTFRVLALPADEFETWRRSRGRRAAAPDNESELTGQRVFLHTCAACHTIEGTPAAGQIGPDLTHIASRRTIAAGTLPNNRGSLGGWIMDPQAIKRGAQMPPNRLSGRDLQALLDYLEALE
jgi:cytochrome c oxidase subunit 2